MVLVNGLFSVEYCNGDHPFNLFSYNRLKTKLHEGRFCHSENNTVCHSTTHAHAYTFLKYKLYSVTNILK